MENKENLLQKLDKSYDSFSKGQKKLADYIEGHLAEAAFMTASALGKAVCVSESTVIRFASACGYDGYPSFQKAMGDLIQDRFSSVTQMEEAGGGSSEDEILHRIFQTDADLIRETMSGIDPDAFNYAVDTILHGKHVYVIGLRNCAPLADFLYYYLQLVCDNVCLINSNGSSDIFEQLIRINEKDVLIGIGFPRYSMRTIKALEFATNRNAKVITLTDSVNSPMTIYSSCNLIAKSEMSSVVDSLTAPMSVINALIISLCMKRRKKVLSRLEDLETVWDEYQVYDKDELNLAGDQMELKRTGEKRS